MARVTVSCQERSADSLTVVGPMEDYSSVDVHIVCGGAFADVVLSAEDAARVRDLLIDELQGVEVPVPVVEFKDGDVLRALAQSSHQTNVYVVQADKIIVKTDGGSWVTSCFTREEATSAHFEKVA